MKAPASDQGDDWEGVPMLKPIAAPMLKSAAHADLVQWLDDRTEYEAKMAAMTTKDPSNAKHVVSVKDSMDPALLEVLCTLEWSLAPEAVTSETITAWVNERLASVKNGVLPDMEQLFRDQLKMDMKQKDVPARILSYWMTFNKIVRNEGLANCFSGPRGVKRKCKLLLDNLCPPALQAEAKRVVQYQHPELLKDERALYALVVKKALECHRYMALYGSKSKKRAAPSEDDDRAPKRAHAETDTAPSDDEDAGQLPVDASVTVEETSPAKPRSRKPVMGCLKCKGEHWLDDCPAATADEKIQLKKEFAKAKRGQGHADSKT